MRGVVKRIGYEQDGFHWDRLDFANHLHPQSAHIAQGVDAGERQGRRRGRPGHHVRLRLRRDARPHAGDARLQPQDPDARWPRTAIPGAAPFLEPDAKSQVTLRFEDGKPAKATAIVVSTQHKPGYDRGEKQAELHAYVKDVVARVHAAELLGNETVYHINPTGSFEIGGPDGDAGITGRKIIVDTYGGAAPHGGGAFSGKDPTKVDRSAAYAARYLAKNIVAAGLARRCTIQLAYAIGVSEPLSLYVDTHGTGTVGDDAIESAIGRIAKLGRLTPRGIRTHLGLNKPIYEATAAYGHFGRKRRRRPFPVGAARPGRGSQGRGRRRRLSRSRPRRRARRCRGGRRDRRPSSRCRSGSARRRRRYRSPVEAMNSGLLSSRSTRLTSSSTTAVTFASMCLIASRALNSLVAEDNRSARRPPPVRPSPGR